MSDTEPLIVTAKFLAFVSYLNLRFEVLHHTGTLSDDVTRLPAAVPRADLLVDKNVS